MDRVKLILKLVGWFAWFTVALLLVTVSAGAAVGAVTGNWANGVIVMFGGAMLLVFGELGRTMIRRMKIMLEDIQRAFIKASDSIEEQAREKK
jgi:hypothetical protein